ncbi:hypothetical protein BC938DRAFT_471087 [Jimgerdemannia flammicorona]|uniref:DNA-directed DNA polymerase n=1 Tax=Jimgerdemannia flammicorona TaxID=994334 RepID=A0A433Q8R2_9FUNG|nr:hypothetical protein BC938DRAFT_471087 [Jimgerdemannia flammicorona]
MALQSDGMCTGMPVHYLDYVPGYMINIETFCGYIYATITIPDHLPAIIPLKGKDGLTYPRGGVDGLYYSEELRVLSSRGYKVTCKSGYLFASADLFSKYVEHFYNLKASATGGERFVYKLLLNGLYGFFCRASYYNESKIVNQDRAAEISQAHPIDAITELSPNLVLVNYAPYLDVECNLLENAITVTSNIAVGAAVTAIARSIMCPYKCDPNNPILYTDTDSGLFPKPLPSTVIGPNLGQWKDELDGDIILDAYFIGAKAYAFRTERPHKFYGDAPSTEKVVVSGFPVGSVSFEQFKEVATIGTKVKVSIDRLVKDRVAIVMKQGSMTRTLRLRDDPK